MPFSISTFVKSLSAVLFALWASVAYGQETSEMRKLCEGISVRLKSFEISEMADDQSGCIIKNGAIDHDSRVQWHFKSLTITGDYGTSGRSYPQLPPRGSFAVDELILLTGRFPGQDYIMRHTATPISYRFSYEFDSKGRSLRVGELSATSKLGRVGLAGEAKVDFDLKAELHAFEEYAQYVDISEFSFEVLNSGLFESLILPLVVGVVGFDVDPEARITSFQSALSDEIAALPESQASGMSKSALKKFIGEFPHPAGPFKASIKFGSPVSAEALRKGEVDVSALLKTVKIDAVYE